MVMERLFACLLLPFLFDIVHFVEADAIQGEYHVWWAIVQLPLDTVQDMISGTDLELLPVPLEGVEPGKRPLLFELGHEFNCGPIFPKSLQNNFMEFKFDIPYVGNKKHQSPVARNYKQVVYIDDTLEAESSRLVYKLNATKPTQMGMTSDFYSIFYQVYGLEAKMSPVSNWGNASVFPNFHAYEEILSLSWFGDTNEKTCGTHHYKFDEAEMRSINLTMKIENGILNGYFPTGEFFIPDVELHKLGAVETRVNFTMTSPYRCE